MIESPINSKLNEVIFLPCDQGYEKRGNKDRKWKVETITIITCLTEGVYFRKMSL